MCSTYYKRIALEQSDLTTFGITCFLILLHIQIGTSEMFNTLKLLIGPFITTSLIQMSLEFSGGRVFENEMDVVAGWICDSFIGFPCFSYTRTNKLKRIRTLNITCNQQIAQEIIFLTLMELGYIYFFGYTLTIYKLISLYLSFSPWHPAGYFTQLDYSDYNCLNYFLFNIGYINERKEYNVPWHRLPLMRTSLAECK